MTSGSDLPEWMISAIITWPYRKAAENGGGVTAELVEDKPGPVDVLTLGQTKKLLKGMQDFSRTEAHLLESLAATTTCCGG